MELMNDKSENYLAFWLGSRKQKLVSTLVSCTGRNETQSVDWAHQKWTKGDTVGDIVSGDSNG